MQNKRIFFKENPYLYMVKLISVKERKKICDLIQQQILNENGIPLKKISNNIASEAILTNDKNLMYFSYLPYLLYKVLTQPHLLHSSQWRSNKKIILDYVDSLEAKELKSYIDDINYFVGMFKTIDRNLYYYIKNIFEKAKIKKASYCYEHGQSINQTLSLTDANRIELMHYLNNSKINFEVGKDIISEKVAIIDDFFK